MDFVGYLDRGLGRVLQVPVLRQFHYFGHLHLENQKSLHFVLSDLSDLSGPSGPSGRSSDRPRESSN
jgi:hypothetical protein